MIFEPHHEKTNNVDFEQVRHKLICKLGILDLKRKKEGLYYPYSKNKGADQLHDYYEADLRLCLCKCKMLGFS